MQVIPTHRTDLNVSSSANAWCQRNDNVLKFLTLKTPITEVFEDKMTSVSQFD